MYFLFSNPPGLNAYLVGGDWVYYAKRVRQFFQHMKDCELIPIVIFDGAHEPEKWKTVIRRYRETLRKNVHSQMPGNSYSPMALSVSECILLLHYYNAMSVWCKVAQLFFFFCAFYVLGSLSGDFSGATGTALSNRVGG